MKFHFELNKKELEKKLFYGSSFVSFRTVARNKTSCVGNNNTVRKEKLPLIPVKNKILRIFTFLNVNLDNFLQFEFRN